MTNTATTMGTATGMAITTAMATDTTRTADRAGVKTAIGRTGSIPRGNIPDSAGTGIRTRTGSIAGRIPIQTGSAAGNTTTATRMRSISRRDSPAAVRTDRHGGGTRITTRINEEERLSHTLSG